MDVPKLPWGVRPKRTESLGNRALPLKPSALGGAQVRELVGEASLGGVVSNIPVLGDPVKQIFGLTLDTLSKEYLLLMVPEKPRVLEVWAHVGFLGAARLDVVSFWVQSAHNDIPAQVEVFP